MMAHKRLIFVLLSLALALMLTQMLVFAQDKGTPDPTSATDYPLATLTTTPLPSSTQPIQIGDHVEIHFDSYDTKEYIYSFQGQAGQAISIMMSTADVGIPYMVLGLPNQRQFTIKGEDNDGLMLHFALRYYELPDDGEYQIRIRAYGEGDANLQVSEAVTIPASFFTLIQGVLTDTQDVLMYQFSASANGRLEIDIDANGFTPIVELYCGRENQCGVSTPITGDSSSQSLIYNLPKKGNYVFVIRQTKIGGTFKLVVSPLQPTPIHYGDQIDATLSDSSAIQQYSFQGRMGDVIQIHVKGDSNLDTRLALWQTIGLVASDDDSGSNFDPEITNAVLSGNGEYTIILRPYQLGVSGKVSLSLERNPIPSLDDGQQILHLSPKFTSMTAVFTAVTDQKVRLTIDTLGNISSQGIRIEVRQNDLILARSLTTDNSNSCIEFVTPKNGKVDIQIKGNSPTALSIERLN